MLNLSVVLEDSARRYPDKTAFVFGDTRLSFAQVNAMACQVANGLVEKGIQPGDKVALSCLNLPYFPVVYYGILKAGAIVVPLNVLLRDEEIAYHLADSDAKAYFSFVGTEQLPMGRFAKKAFDETDTCKHLFMITAQPADASPYEGIETLGQLMSQQPGACPTWQSGAEDTAVIIYTSGTTGRPKGAELTHNNLFLNAYLCRELAQMTKDDVALLVLPMFHIFGQTFLLNAGVCYGVTNVLMPRFDAEQAIGLIIKEKVTVFAGVPTMYWGLLNYKGEQDTTKVADNLRLCVSGGASLPVKVLEDFESRFNVPIIEGYGMSEGSPVVTFNQLDVGRKPGSIGTRVWGIDVKITDENGNEVKPGEKGELLYRGHNVMKGYYRKKEATAKALKDGWMHSGDIATEDEEGFFYIVDRVKDLIIRGGMNVYPREVEEIMMKHEAVSMVAVIGVPDEESGEEVKACVVRKDGASVDEQSLIAWCKEHMAAYKFPRIIEFRDNLPMNATGKILKKELRQEVEA